jgi:hypothetical protein
MAVTIATTLVVRTMDEESSTSNNIRLCECGKCNLEVRGWNSHTHQPIRFRPGHNSLPGEDSRAWKGGEYKSGDYIYVSTTSTKRACKIGRDRKHRVVYEDSRNCCLLPWTDVHHLDNNGLNNVWYNLQAMMKSKHLSVTHYGRKKSKADENTRCVDCGSSITYMRKLSNDRRTPFWTVVDKINDIWRCSTCYEKLRYNSHKDQVKARQRNYYHTKKAMTPLVRKAA